MATVKRPVPPRFVTTNDVATLRQLARQMEQLQYRWRNAGGIEIADLLDWSAGQLHNLATEEDGKIRAYERAVREVG